MSRKILLVCVLLASLSQEAVADKICLRSLIKNGKVVNSIRTISSAKKCAKGFTQILETKQIVAAAASQGLQGIQGPQGAQGPQGIQGPKGDQGVSGASKITGDADLGPVDSTSPKIFAIDCPTGSIAIGGNATLYKGLLEPYDGANVRITFAAPTLTGSSFTARGVETAATNDNWGIFVSVICKYPD